MKNIKPYQLFWLPIPIMFLLGVLLPSEMDLYVYKNHYVIKPAIITVYISVFLFMSGIGYFLIRKQELNLKFYKSHKKYTAIGTALCIVTTLVLYFIGSEASVDRFNSGPTSFSLDQFMALTFMVGILMLFVGFMVYLTYILIALFFKDRVVAK